MSVKHFLFGGIASLTAEVGEYSVLSRVSPLRCHRTWAELQSTLVSLRLTGTFPIDTTKTRLQVQGQQKDVRCQQSRYRGMTHALLHIAREEGVGALYGGYVPCLWTDWCVH